MSKKVKNLPKNQLFWPPLRGLYIPTRGVGGGVWEKHRFLTSVPAFHIDFCPMGNPQKVHLSFINTPRGDFFKSIDIRFLKKNTHFTSSKNHAGQYHEKATFFLYLFTDFLPVPKIEIWITRILKNESNVRYLNEKVALTTPLHNVIYRNVWIDFDESYKCHSRS